jgi:signal transduction histidine kinase
MTTKQQTEAGVDQVRAAADRHAETRQDDAVAQLEAALTPTRAKQCATAHTWRRAVHDLRGGVGAISCAYQLLKRADMPEEVRYRSHAAVQKGLDYLDELLNDLASLAQLQAAQEPLELSTFDVSRLLRRLAEMVRPSADSRGLTLTALGPEFLAVEGDAMKIQRIAQNLVINAIEHTKGKLVEIHWTADAAAPEQRWILTVRNSGAAADAACDSTVIPAFRTLGDPKSPSMLAQIGAGHGTRGHGIGLSIVRSFCDLLGASAEVRNEVGHGLTFRVTFPSRHARRVNCQRPR